MLQKWKTASSSSKQLKQIFKIASKNWEILGSHIGEFVLLQCVL